MKTPLRLRVADGSGRFLWGARSGVSMDELQRGNSLGERLLELSGRSILLATRDQLAAALAIIALDGVASRIIICPPGIPWAHFPALITIGGVDAVVSDYDLGVHDFARDLLRVPCDSCVLTARAVHTEHRPTEWVLLTSGTTGAPKMIVHTLASLMAPMAVKHDQMKGCRVVWGTFYDIRRYGGLQIFLRAVLGHGSLVLSSVGEPVAEHLARLGTHGVTHLSGTPSHWRRTLMSPHARRIAPQYIRLSGEIADQAILDTLQSFYPKSAIGHAFASTEAGVAFEVNDGLAGFPSNLLSRHGDVEMKIGNDSLQIRSDRTASRYLDVESGALADEDGFVDTGDIVELRADRYYFLGRRNGVINVGGLKVFPEEVEAVIHRHPAVRMAMVHARRNPLMGALVSADVVLREDDGPVVRGEILNICRQNLPPHKIPVTIRCVPSLTVAAAGKLARHHT